MKLIKNTNFITSMFLSLVLCLSFLLPSIINAKQELSVRDINVNEIGTLSYEEKARSLVDVFDKFEYDYSNNSITFNGSMTDFITKEMGLDFVSSYNEPITKILSTNYDIENGVIYIVTSYYQSDTLINQDTIEANPYYDENTDDFFVKMEDGSVLSIKSTLEQSNLNETLAITATVTTAYMAYLAAAALTVTLIAAAPVIEEIVTTVVTTVVSVVKSFISWFKTLFTTKTSTVTSTSVTKTYSPTITLDKTTYKTKTLELTKQKDIPMSKTEYFLALADTVNGTMHVSILPIEDYQAVAVMNAPVAVEIWQNPRVTVATSIYTYYESNALLITSIAGLSSRTPAGFPEKHGNGYYWHYHSISTVTTIDKNGKTHQSNAHAFFGLPA